VPISSRVRPPPAPAIGRIGDDPEAAQAMHHPTFEEFRKLSQQGNVVPIRRQLICDTLTPVSAYAKIADSPYAFLLESVIGGEKIARHSFLGSDPFVVFRADGNDVTVTRGGASTKFHCSDPLTALQELMSPYKAVHLPGMPRFTGGAVGYASYDSVRYLENLPHAPTDDRGLPDLLFGLYSTMVLFDHVKKTISVVHNAHIDGHDLRVIYEHACRAIDAVVDKLRSPVSGGTADIELAGDELPEFTSNFSRDGFESAVSACKEYIKAGDIFQVVLSQRLAVPTQVPALDIYRTLRAVNPSPFMFLLKTPGVDLVGSSPEILCRVEDGVITNRPLAGTRKRGLTDEEDRKLAEELLADPKDRAEHIMLVDLGRNDVGRVAEFGSVRVDEMMQIERYSHVMHICSNVTGKLRAGLSCFDALRHALPVGTVSGAPKVRAMQIIDEFEPTRRGPYAGAVGYVDYSGNMDTCIALRTLVIKDGIAYVQVGAGLVADSVPALEYEETMNKARAMLRALKLSETVAKSPVR